MADRTEVENAIRGAVTEAMSKLSDEELRELVLDPYDALRSLLSETQEDQWEYAPGHHWIDANGNGHWFVQSGTIAPGYVQQYLAEGGEAIRRRVGPWEPVPVEEDNRVDRRPHDKYDTEIPEG